MSKQRNEVTFSAEDIVKVSNILKQFDGAVIRRDKMGQLWIHPYTQHGVRKEDEQLFTLAHLNGKIPVLITRSKAIDGELPSYLNVYGFKEDESGEVFIVPYLDDNRTDWDGSVMTFEKLLPDKSSFIAVSLRITDVEMSIREFADIYEDIIVNKYVHYHGLEDFFNNEILNNDSNIHAELSKLLRSIIVPACKDSIEIFSQPYKAEAAVENTAEKDDEQLFTLGILDDHRVLFTDGEINVPIPEPLYAYDIKEVEGHGHVVLEFRTHNDSIMTKGWKGTIISMNDFPQGDRYGQYHGDIILLDNEMTIGEYIERYQRGQEIRNVAQDAAYRGILEFFEDEDLHHTVSTIMTHVMEQFVVNNFLHTSPMSAELRPIITNFIISVCKDLGLVPEPSGKQTSHNSTPRNIAPIEEDDEVENDPLDSREDIPR